MWKDETGKYISLSTSVSLGDYHPSMLHIYHYLQDSVTRTTNRWSREPSNKDVHFRKKILSGFPSVKTLLVFRYRIYFHYIVLGTRWRGLLRHCATSRKVAGSIPDGVIGIFHSHYPSGRTMTLGFTQPLTEISTRNIFWGGGGG